MNVYKNMDFLVIHHESTMLIREVDDDSLPFYFINLEGIYHLFPTLMGLVFLFMYIKNEFHSM